MTSEATGREHESMFESIRHSDEDGDEYWDARELMVVLGYTNWRNFNAAIRAAMVTCESNGYVASQHFDATAISVPLGNGAHRTIDDYHLSRYACYLVVMNGDVTKPAIALG